MDMMRLSAMDLTVGQVPELARIYLGLISPNMRNYYSEIYALTPEFCRGVIILYNIGL